MSYSYQPGPHPHYLPGYGTPPRQPAPAGYAPPPGYPGYPPPGYAPQGNQWPAHFPAPSWHHVAPGDARIFQIGLRKHTGVLIVFFTQAYVFTGTLAECEKAYRDAQTHNLLAGWWSLASIVVVNWLVMGLNLRNIQKLRRIAQQPSQPQPQPPTPYQQRGFHGQQHWGQPGRR